MDNNHLTPNKIQRLIHLAEDKSFGVPTPSRHNLIPGDVYKSTPFKPVQVSLNCESSSGILDVDKLDAFGESGLGLGNFSLSKSTAFNPGEMTGRSTGTEDIVATPAKTSAFEASLAIDNIASHANKQTSEINDIMRQSIATNYSFHSKRDLTADEASLIMREAPIPIPMSQFTPFPESAMSTASEISVGTYFKNRCTDFGNILKHTDSPDRASMTDATPSCIENALNNYDVYKMDPCLDNVPVKEARSPLANKRGHISPSQSPIANKVVPLTKSNQCNQNVNRNNPAPPTFQGMKPTDILIKNLQASLRPANEDTEGSVENSMSISKIADYLGKESNVSVTDMLKYGKRKSPKKPLVEINMNSQNNNTTRTYEDVTVTTLKDTRQMDTASSTDTCNTVICVENLKITDQNVPSIVVSGSGEAANAGTTKSKSPSCKTTPTLSTVWESNSSFNVNETPQRVSKGDRSPSSHERVSRSIVYKELDKSVDWQDVLQHKYTHKEECMAKEQWAEISTTPANGYVGVSAAVGMKITTLTDNWLTARIQFDLKELNKELILELPRSPMLLSPKKTETLTIYLTSNIELHTTLKYTLHLKDASVDKEIEQTGDLNVNIRVPTIQALSNDGFNKLNFSSIQENTSLTKSFVLISDCPVGLQLELSVVEGESLFVIRSIQEIMKCDVNRIVGEQQGLIVEGKCRSKSKKQLCRLVSGNAIRVTITFNAPRLSELQIKEPLVTFKGVLHVNLFDVNCVLKKVDLLAVVGVVQLHINVCEKLQVSKEGTLVTLTNKGSIPAVWSMKVLPKTLNDMESPFKVIPDTVKIKGGESKNITVAYTGPDDISHEATLVFENVGSIKNPSIDIVGGTDKPKAFPIKTNFNNMSWVRSERKELSLKNSTDRKIRIRCRVLGEGFQIDLPGVDTRGSMILTFEAHECRPLPLLFAPTNPRPHVASLNLVYDNELSRKVKLHGCASDWGGGGPGLRWSGLVTYGDTALVRAVSRAPIHLHLANKSNAPAFICASLHFNLQYMFLSGHTAVSGARCVVRARSTHVVTVSPAWALVERRSHIAHTSALGTLKALTGHELTRRRILKILRNESDGVLDTTLIPDNLRVLVETFADEDPVMDSELAEFQETKASLNELISGIQELTAQIDLPQEFQEDATIVIADDTALVEHHTLVD